jgi:hypothetical protein
MEFYYCIAKKEKMMYLHNMYDKFFVFPKIIFIFGASLFMQILVHGQK